MIFGDYTITEERELKEGDIFWGNCPYILFELKEIMEKMEYGRKVKVIEHNLFHKTVVEKTTDIAEPNTWQVIRKKEFVIGHDANLR